MKKSTLLAVCATVLLLFGSSGSGWGQVTLPHYEPINYTVGQGLQTQTGWTVLNSGDDLLIASGNLSYSGLLAPTGNKVTFDGAGIDAAKLFTQQTSGTVYYSFLLNVTSLGSLNTTGGYFTGFTEGTSNTFGATVWTRSDGAGYDIGINPKTTAANTVWSSGTTSINTTLFIVVSYQIVSGTLNDVVKLWINPTPGGTEPAATLSATNGVASDLANINRIFIRQDGASATPFIEMDELRIGTTWASVTPASSLDPTLTTTASTLSGFTYVFGNGPSTSQYYELNGSNLTPASGNITVTGTTDYEVSTDNSSFSGSVNVPYSSSTLTNYKVYVHLKSGLGVGTYNGEQISNAGGGASTVYVTCNGSVTAPTPVITTSVSSLSGFYTAYGTASTSQNYTVSGDNLTADVTVTAPSKYEVSTDNSTFSSSVILTQSGGNIVGEPKTVYARITATATTGAASGNITHSSTDATTVNVAVSGTVMYAEPTTQATSITFSSVTSTTMTIGWTSGNGAKRIVLMKAGSAVDSPPVDGTDYTASTTFGSGTQIGTGNYVVYANNASSVPVSGLSGGITYYVAVYEYNGSSPYTNYLTTNPATNSQATLNDFNNISALGAAVAQNFDAMASDLILPGGFLMGERTASVTWAAGVSSVTQEAHTGSPTSGGTYNWGNTAGTERAVGSMTSGSFASPNSIMAKYRNNTGYTITALTINYDLERYRINSATASLSFYYSLNGSSWTAVTAGDIASSLLPTGTSSYDFNPSGTPSNTNCGVISKTGISVSSLSLSNGSDIYLRWNLVTVGSNSQGIGVDNLSVTACGSLSAPTSATASVNPLCSGNSTVLTLSGGSVGVTGTIIKWYTSSCGGTLAGTGNDLSVSPTITTTYYGRCENACGDVTTCVNVTVTVNQPVTPSVTIAASANPVYQGTSVTFTPTPVNGGTPTYQWYKNSQPVSTDNTYTYTPANGDEIYVAMTSTATCATPATVNSDIITMNVTSEITWTGAVSTAWNLPGNWNPNQIPNFAHAHIPAVSNQPHISNTGNIPNSITMDAGTVLTIEDGGELTLNTGVITKDNSTSNNLVVKSGGLLRHSFGSINARIERVITPGHWHNVSSPVVGAKSGVFESYFLMDFNTNGNLYNYITATNQTLNPMQGYSVYVDGTSDFTAVFSGLTHYNSSLWYSVDVSSAGQGWNLVGNPFPYPVYWSYPGAWDKTNVDASIYIENGGVWATWVSGDGGLGGAGTNGGNGNISSCQGFFVHANSNGQLKVNANAQTGTNGFLKNGNDIVPDMVRLEVSGNGFKDEALVRLMPDATTEFDGNYDAFKLYGSEEKAPQLYSLGTVPLAINSIPEAVPVPVGVKASISGTYTIAATEINDLTNVKLEDTKTGIITSLADNSYTFNWEAGEDEHRFILRFASVGVSEPDEANCFIYSYDKTVSVELPAGIKGDVYIYNLAGQPVAAKESVTGQVRINLSPTGVYVVKVVTDKETLTKKVWIR